MPITFPTCATLRNEVGIRGFEPFTVAPELRTSCSLNAFLTKMKKQQKTCRGEPKCDWMCLNIALKRCIRNIWTWKITFNLEEEPQLLPTGHPYFWAVLLGFNRVVFGGWFSQTWNYKTFSAIVWGIWTIWNLGAQDCESKFPKLWVWSEWFHEMYFKKKHPPAIFWDHCPILVFKPFFPSTTPRTKESCKDELMWLSAPWSQAQA